MAAAERGHRLTRWLRDILPIRPGGPAETPVAQWVTSLGLGFNDLSLSHRRLIDGLIRDAPPEENGYDARLSGSHVWEVCKLLRTGRDNPDLSGFIGGLPAALRSELDAALSIFDDPTRAGFRGALGRARDHFSHYPEPGRRELIRALAAFGRDNHDGELWLDRDLRRSRARWADDVAMQLFVRAEGEDTTPLSDFTTELRDLALKLIHVLVGIIKAYFDGLPGGVVVPVPHV
jgi:hypothetical protein